ncbi:putative cyclin-dependent kinase F-2 [Phragmites australis]|uniref:putative cyclin-dependent kinase F-2 n=1 Tax=Phragmites australis TaxID=29695 RepID=UPI002D77E697|nr:putative cyclin-dependent kinase F-2 [Phragmites australis]
MSTAKSRPPYTQVGAVRYMAPEMLMDMPDYDERVDLWSLGCVMAELRLRELFPSEMLSPDGFDVLKGLLTLTCNPKERLTAAAALRNRARGSLTPSVLLLPK